MLELDQRRAGRMSRREINGGLIGRAETDGQFLAVGHSLERRGVEGEVCSLTPGSYRLVGTVAEFRRLDGRQHEGAVIQVQRHRALRMNISDLPVIAGCDVDPEPVA